MGKVKGCPKCAHLNHLQLPLTWSEVQRLLAWAKQGKRQPAHVHFTAGAARDCARVIEQVIK